MYVVYVIGNWLKWQVCLESV